MKAVAVVAFDVPMQMIVANRLKDGRVVFMAPGSGWTESIEQGVVTDGEPESAELLAEAERAVRQCVVVDPYLIDVTVEDGRRRPVRLREVIRAFGPSVRDSEAAARS